MLEAALHEVVLLKRILAPGHLVAEVEFLLAGGNGARERQTVSLRIHPGLGPFAREARSDVGRIADAHFDDIAFSRRERPFKGKLLIGRCISEVGRDNGVIEPAGIGKAFVEVGKPF